MNISTGKTIVFFIIVITVNMVDSKVHKRCQSSSDCGAGECCTSGNV